MKSEHDNLQHDAEPLRDRDALIGRLLADPTDDDGEEIWSQFRAHAGRDAAAWEQLARAFREEIALRTAAERDHSNRRATIEIDRALVNACSASDSARGVAAEDGRALSSSASSPPRRAHGVFGWAGWAVAAGLMVIWSVSFLGSVQDSAAPHSTDATRTIAASFTADEAYDQYVSIGEKAGRVVAELPTVMVESRAMPDGTFEVLYVRQLLERETVSGMYELQPN
ncbi:MAG: hypothetical protein EA377_05010, partial [Phycisphaerales bacterium]